MSFKRFSCVMLMFALEMKIASASVITLYNVANAQATTRSDFQVIQSFSESYSYIGAAKDNGAPRFQVEFVQSLLLGVMPTRTETYISEPTTLTYTVEQGPSQYRVDFPYGGGTSSESILCNYDLGKGVGDCQDVFPEDTITITEDKAVVTSTIPGTTFYWSGAPTPYATVTYDGESGPNGGNTGSSNNDNAGNGATRGSVGVLGLVATGLITGFLLTLRL